MSERRVLLDGLAMGESPRWHEGRLWLCDWAAHEILAADEAGRRHVIATVPSMPFSIDWLPDGRLLVIVGREARLLVGGPGGGPLEPFADLSGISRKPWNEIVVDGRGNIYLNNIGFEFPGETPAPGFVALVTPDGSARVVAEGLSFPNGMAVTPDNGTLIVGESYADCLTAFEIAADGSLLSRRVWAATPGDHPDGICLDADGAVWYGDVGSSRCVRVREGGQVLEVVHLDRGCFACVLGGFDRRTLYMVAADFSDPGAIMSGRSRTGCVIATEAPASAAGWP
jgi:sugar lactone lactonase YvrE